MTTNKNAFDLLRVILALLVLISHGYLLTGRGNEPLDVFSKRQTNLSEIGVMGFFSLSGYLITSSFDRSSNILRYLKNRFLRIFPGYWVCLIITAFIIAPSIFYINNKTLTGFSFKGADSSLSFIYSNSLLSIKQWSIGNVLQSSVYQDSINGSLWSLFPEALCYLLTIVLGVFGLLNKNKPVFLLLLVFVYIIYVVNINPTTQFGPTFLILSNARKLYTCYLCGMCLYIFRDQFVIDVKGLLFILLSSITLLKFGGFLIIAPMALAILIIKGFSTFQTSIKYDISYGLYIYAFPVEQLMYKAVPQSFSFPLYIMLCILLTGIMGFLSFIAIERPFLRLKNIKEKTTSA